MNQQAIAAKLVHQVLYQNKNLKLLLLQNNNSSQVKSWTYSTCRFAVRLKFIISKLCHQKIAKPLKVIESLLLVGVMQCLEGKRPVAIIIDQTVQACVFLDHPKCKGFVNAVLRNFLRKKDRLWQDFDEYALYSHSNFLLSLIQNDWPNDWQQIVAANNSPAAVHLRCRDIDQRDNVVSQLVKQQVCQKSQLVASGIVLTETSNLLQIIGQFPVCVQDCGAQKLVDYLPKDIRPTRILDACAAPGGKTAIIADFYQQAEIVAVDNSRVRALTLQNNLKQWQLDQRVNVICADLTKTIFDKQFDLIVLDAPCTGFGVISRQPDIKINTNKKHIASCLAKQKNLLEKMWSLVMDKGFLIYVTCSVLHQEGHLQIMKFLAKHADASVVGGSVDYSGEYILPAEWNNGFYFCLLQKNK